MVLVVPTLVADTFLVIVASFVWLEVALLIGVALERLLEWDVRLYLGRIETFRGLATGLLGWLLCLTHHLIEGVFVFVRGCLCRLA